MSESFGVGLAGRLLYFNDPFHYDLLDQFGISVRVKILARVVERLAHDLGHGIVKYNIIDAVKYLGHFDTPSYDPERDGGLRESRRLVLGSGGCAA